MARILYSEGKARQVLPESHRIMTIRLILQTTQTLSRNLEFQRKLKRVMIRIPSLALRGHLVKQMKFQRKLKRVTIRIPSLALKGRKLKAMKLQNLTTVVKRTETL